MDYFESVLSASGNAIQSIFIHCDRIGYKLMLKIQKVVKVVN